jgi:hypothetical protein
MSTQATTPDFIITAESESPTSAEFGSDSGQSAVIGSLITVGSRIDNYQCPIWLRQWAIDSDGAASSLPGQEPAMINGKKNKKNVFLKIRTQIFST